MREDPLRGYVNEIGVHAFAHRLEDVTAVAGLLGIGSLSVTYAGWGTLLENRKTLHLLRVVGFTPLATAASVSATYAVPVAAATSPALVAGLTVFALVIRAIGGSGGATKQLLDGELKALFVAQRRGIGGHLAEQATAVKAAVEGDIAWDVMGRIGRGLRRRPLPVREVMPADPSVRPLVAADLRAPPVDRSVQRW